MFIDKIRDFADEYLFNPKWKCNSCGKEIFGEGYFCKECYEKLPFILPPYCGHCGRKTASPQEYCLTCKGRLTAVDKARSVFEYTEPINTLIKRLKFGKHKYVADIFTDYTFAIFSAEFYEDDYITFVPMTAKAIKERGFNQSELLARNLAKRANKPVLDCIVKCKDTLNQATLSAKERRLNLKGVFKIVKEKDIKGKSFLLVDDVTTTGETAQLIAEALKKQGATRVDLLTVANVSYIEN